MNADRIKWDRIFSARSALAPSPPSFLKDYIQQIQGGKILDLACGDGAITHHLLALNEDVVSLDISHQALIRSKLLYPKPDALLSVEADLDSTSLPFKNNVFDTIIIGRFKPSEAHWQSIVEALKLGGTLLIATFNQYHHQQTGFNRNYCLLENELQNIHPQLNLKQYLQTQRQEGQFDEYLFIKEPELLP